MKLDTTIRAYHNTPGDHPRYRSWEHCYTHFQQAGPRGILASQEHAALHLGFYLASWGMYRGSSFLLQNAFTVHLPFVRAIAVERLGPLWGLDFGAKPSHADLIPLVLELMEVVRKAYEPVALANGSKPPTPTLVTKVILGTFGCVPACDQFFLTGIKLGGIKYWAPGKQFLERVLVYCQDHLEELQEQQRRIQAELKIHYPLMKLVDMQFWQWGSEEARAKRVLRTKP